MKKIIFRIAALSVAAAAVISCKESEKLMFDQPASIYLKGSQAGGDDMNYTTQDSIQYTFLGKPDDFTGAKANIYMQVTGFKSSQARRINLVADPASTLIAGTDYELLADLVLPAEALEVTIPIVFKRTDKLRDNLYWVKFTVEDSDDLKMGYDDNLSFKYIVTEKPVRPTNWQTSYYGEYSAAKLRFMYSVLGSDINWSAYPPEHMANSGKVREALAKYERENGPLYGLAEDGEENVRVTFPG